MLKKIYTLVLFAIFSALIISSVNAGQERSKFDPKVDSWYDVQEWEVEVCSQWGGIGEVQKSSATPFGSETYLYSMAITLQAEKKRHYVGDANFTYIYDVGWYIQPLKGSVDYKVYLVTESGHEKLLGEGAANMRTGDSGYYAEENTSIAYENAKIVYGEGSGLLVPVVSYN